MDVNNQAASLIREPKEKRQQKYMNFKLRSEDKALLELLPERQRELLTAEGSYLEIASRFGLPIGTVRSRLHRARAALEKLRHDGGEEAVSPVIKINRQ
jgi:DNA-directed RNA polymerase specialized sigma24 family protein